MGADTAGGVSHGGAHVSQRRPLVRRPQWRSMVRGGVHHGGYYNGYGRYGYGRKWLLGDFIPISAMANGYGWPYSYPNNYYSSSYYSRALLRQL